MLLPPVNLVFAILLGVALLRRFPRSARWLIGVAALLLLVLAMPAVAGGMLVALERDLPTTPPADKPPGAIVILGGDVTRTGGVEPGAIAGHLTLERLRAGAALQRKTGLPVLVSGGEVGKGAPPVAVLMRESLTQDFQVPVRWTEDRSSDTWQNARDSAAILRSAGINSIYLVTNAWHERRALMAFAGTGLTVTAAPTPLDRPAGPIPSDFVPRALAWEISSTPCTSGSAAFGTRCHERPAGGIPVGRCVARGDRVRCLLTRPGCSAAAPGGAPSCPPGCRRGRYPASCWRGPAPRQRHCSRCAGRYRAGRWRVCTTPYTCEYAPLLARGLSAAAQGEVLAGFARFCRGWATTRLDALPEDWPGLPACVEGARAAGLVVVRFAHFGNWHAPVRGLDWAGYLAGRPGALRETVRRKLRRGERRADAGFAVVTGRPELEAGIDAFDQVYARSWKQPEPFPRFNAALMREAAATGLLRLGIWRIGDVPAAAQLWIVEHGTATVLKLAHDEAFQAELPGTVLTALMLRTLLDQEHVAEIDFGRGDDDYKQGWAGQRRQRIGVVLVNPRRPAGLRFLAQHALGRARARFASSGRPGRGAQRTEMARAGGGAVGSGA